MGMEKQARSLGIDEETNVKINNAYNRAFPEARKLMNKAMRVAEERGYVKTFLGRRGRFPEKKNYHSALNKVLQGTAADIMKLKLCVMYYEMRKEFDLTMRSTVHDEANSDAPMDIDREKYEARMNEQMLDLDVPILWKTGYGHNWMEAGD
jgi:DNA polymerase-1